MDGSGLRNMRRQRLITFAVVCVLVLIINTPGPLFAIGEYNGVWAGPETVTVPGYGSATETTGTVIYQEDQNTLYFFDPLFGAIQLIKSGSSGSFPHQFGRLSKVIKHILPKFRSLFIAQVI